MPALVVVDADAEVDLAQAGVGIELLVQAEDGITGGKGDIGEQRDMTGFLKGRWQEREGGEGQGHALNLTWFSQRSNFAREPQGFLPCKKP